MERALFKVTTKAAIYSDDGKQVIVMDIIDKAGRPGVGLPGGHIETGETPDAAMRRELDEELGIDVYNMTRRDFFLHDTLDKIVLAYTAQASADQAIVPESDWCQGRWVSRAEFEQLDTGAYKKFVLANWP